MLYHWCSTQAWGAVEDAYSPASLSEEGFVHFSFRGQVERTAAILNRGERGLVLLCVDETDLEVVVEDSYGTGEEFPHVYGPIPRSMVKAVLSFPPEPDGSFRLPVGD